MLPVKKLAVFILITSFLMSESISLCKIIKYVEKWDRLINSILHNKRLLELIL